MTDALAQPVSTIKTLVHRLRDRAHAQPEGLCYVFLHDGAEESGRVTYAELDRWARAVAVSLVRLGLGRGDRALLLLPSSLEYMAGFFGCLYTGVIPVPLFEMTPGQPRSRLPRMQAIVGDADPGVALCMSRDEELTRSMFRGLAGLDTLELLAIDHVELDQADRWLDPGIAADEICFLQYTSGSTARPKGVMVSHGNLMENSRMLAEAFEQRPETSQVTWLPLFHDMGLIGTVLQTLQTGSHCVFMPPVAFLRRPVRWLQAITKYGARISGGPNFAYDLCVRKVTAEQMADLDLTSWDLAFCGAEPVRPETMRSFSQTFAACGLKETTLYPCYGLAESTLFVTGGRKREAPVFLSVRRDHLETHRITVVDESHQMARALVGCGRAWQGMAIAIVDPATRRLCSCDQVGEIWLSSGSVTKGYWHIEEETKAIFDGRIVGSTSGSVSTSGPFLRTGDLGFLHGSELYVTGRIKDLVLINGQNHYPQDIEATVLASHPGLRPGGCAAFTIEASGKEQLVVVAEVDAKVRLVEAGGPGSPTSGSAGEVAEAKSLDPVTFEREVRRRVVEHHELLLHDLALVSAGSMPKTSSGKIQRRVCKDRYLNGQLQLWSG